MYAWSVADILTFNGGHFERFPGIRVIDPTEIGPIR
jgi:hypothetical protein